MNNAMNFRLEHAPMEGVTGCVYRSVHRKYFPGADAYYTPFLSLNQNNSLKSKEKKDIDPKNNAGFFGTSPRLVPQVLVSAAHPEQFLMAAEYLKSLGYDEVNLNAGCPSATVVTKHKGAGILEDPDALDAFLDAVFDGLDRLRLDMKISVKTRLGLHSPGEMPALMTVYNRYPLSELIIHARVKDQLYSGRPDLETFHAALSVSRNPVSFNGDVNFAADLNALSASGGPLNAVMCGRGVLRDPALFREMKGGPAAQRKELKAFTEELFEATCDSMKSVRDAMFRMKELWSYLGPALAEKGSSSGSGSFGDSAKCLKIIRRTSSVEEYKAAVRALLEE